MFFKDLYFFFPEINIFLIAIFSLVYGIFNHKKKNLIKRIILIDDVMGNFLGMKQGLEKIEIKFKGYHYTGSLNMDNELVPIIVEFQKRMILSDSSRVISDSEAEIIFNTVRK